VETADGDLEYVHYLIQATMGWTNTHMHQFQIGRDYYGLDPDGEMDLLDPSKVTLASLWRQDETKFRYEYDFGDSWLHDIVIEEKVSADNAANYPRCIAGRNACPVEDCGGPGGYANMVKALKNPRAKNHDEMTAWVREDFDPAEFSLENANTALAAGPEAYAPMW
jgi:hypothetical protein